MEVKAIVKKETQEVPVIAGLNQLERAADYVVKSGLFGITKKEQAIALMLLSQSEGMHPMRAIQEYHIIQGRPAMRADAMLARFQRAGGKIVWHELNDKKAKATFEHPQGGRVTIEWTIEMAKKAGLLDKQGSNWLKYPRAMLRARVISEGIRTVYPGVIVGVYTPEEVQDFTEPVEAQVVENGEVINKETGEIIEEKPQEKPQEEPEEKSQEKLQKEKPQWTWEKIQEVATDELKQTVKQFKVTLKELINLFNEFDGDQQKIVDKIKEIKTIGEEVKNA